MHLQREAADLARKMKNAGFKGEVVSKGGIAETIDYILQKAENQDFIFIGGSSYVVAEAIRFFDEKKGDK